MMLLLCRMVLTWCDAVEMDELGIYAQISRSRPFYYTTYIVFMTLKMRCFMADEWVCDPHHTWIQDLSRSSLSPCLLVLVLLRGLELQST